MNRRLLTLILCLISLCVQADDGTTVMELSFDSPYAVKVSGSQITHPEHGLPVLTISRTDTTVALSQDEPYYQVTLFRIPNPPLTSKSFVLSGEVAYQNLPNESQLQLVTSILAGPSSMLTATDRGEGPQKYLVGTSDWRPFLIPVAISGIPGQILQIEINAGFFGRLRAGTPSPAGHLETLSLRNLKLVQYPDPPPALTDSTPIAPAPGLHWPSFWIGTTACAMALLALAQLLLLVRRYKRARDDREMRRIASLDS